MWQRMTALTFSDSDFRLPAHILSPLTAIERHSTAGGGVNGALPRND